MSLFKHTPSPEPEPALPTGPTPSATPPSRKATSFFRRTARSPSPPPPPSSAPSGMSDYRSAQSNPAREQDGQSVRSGFFFGRRRSADSLAPSSLRSPTASMRSPAPAPAAASIKSGAGSVQSGRAASIGTGRWLGLPLKKHPANDPAVLLARAKIHSAEEAEAEADRAVLHARARVRDAMQSVGALEEESRREAEHAAAKKQEAKGIKGRAGVLGRHG
ncbi:hypothetical protein DFH07DRAFT_815129 [Mycena maculata]|uniref:Uncharacterized protein n=1 Tax=Mycena maculata TaxID=230809 RepID=A0AAD7NI49_9AGAR|nr:hypothetical protein DFH07DRAFT_815129 [Mycena maculata]